MTRPHDAPTPLQEMVGLDRAAEEASEAARLQDQVKQLKFKYTDVRRRLTEAEVCVWRGRACVLRARARVCPCVRPWALLQLFRVRV
jgi:hypothetical protein